MNSNENMVDRLNSEKERLENKLFSLFQMLNVCKEIVSVADVKEFYKTILDVLVVHFGSKRHSIAVYDNHYASLKVVASKLEDDDIELEYSILEEGIVKEVIETKKVYVALELDAGKKRDAVACIPLIFNNNVLGVIICHELLSHKESFNDDDIELFNMLSNLCGAVLFSAKMQETNIKKIKSKEKTLEKLYDLTRLLASEIKIEKVLNIIERVTKDIFNCDIISIRIYDKKTNDLILRLHSGIEITSMKVQGLDIDGELSRRVFNEKIPILIKNTASEIKFKELAGSNEVRFLGKSIISSPILIRGECIGVLSISNYAPNAFDADEKKILVTLSAEAALGIYNAFLYENERRDFMGLSSFFNAANQIHSALRMADLFKTVDKLIDDFISGSEYMIFIKNEHDDKFFLIHSTDKENIEKEYSFTNEIIKSCYKKSEAYLFSGDGDKTQIQINGNNFSVMACVPFTIEGKIFGFIVINELNPNKDYIEEKDLEFLEILSNHIGMAILRAILFKNASDNSFPKSFFS